MAKVMKVVPHRFPCTLSECPPGLFVDDDELCVKTAYRDDGGFSEAYLADGGDAYWGGTSSKEKREQLIVQPCLPVWVEDDY